MRMRQKKKLKEHLFTIAIVGGFATTIFFAIKKTPEAEDILENTLDNMEGIMNDADANNTPDADVNRALNREKLFFVRDASICYAPMIIAAIATLTLIFVRDKKQSDKNAMLTSAMNAGSIVYQEYRDRVRDILGDEKERLIVADVENNHVQRAPVPRDILETGNGSTLCAIEIEPGSPSTMLYFRSDPQSVRAAENDINEWLLDRHGDHKITQADALYFLGLHIRDRGTQVRYYRLTDEDSLFHFQYDSFIHEKLKEPVLFLGFDNWRYS